MAEWQPVETAPTDTDLLLFGRFGSQRGLYTGIKNARYGWSYSFMGTEDVRDDYYGDDVNPTHWMPLPEPPSSA